MDNSIKHGVAGDLHLARFVEIGRQTLVTWIKQSGGVSVTSSGHAQLAHRNLIAVIGLGKQLPIPPMPVAIVENRLQALQGIVGCHRAGVGPVGIRRGLIDGEGL